MSADGFSKVVRKSRKAFKPVPFVDKLADRKTTLQRYGFFEQFDETWNRCRASLPAGSAPKRIVCLALGSFQSSWQTQMQLLLLQHLVILLNVDPSQVSVADPVFEDEDIQYLEKQLFDPRKSSDGFWGPFDGTTLYYIPHGPRWLCEKILISNTQDIADGRVCIIGNDFSHYDSYVKKKDQEEIPTILELSRQFQTVPLPGSTNKNDGLYEAFHALSIQWSAAKVVSGPAEEINQHAVG